MIGTGSWLDSYGTVMYNLGNAGGERMHQLTIPEMPIHNFTFMGTKNLDWEATTDTSSSSGLRQYVWRQNQTNYVGGDQPHNIMQPYVSVHWIMKL